MMVNKFHKSFFNNQKFSLLSSKDSSNVVSFFISRFGIPESFFSDKLFFSFNKHIWCVSNSFSLKLISSESHSFQSFGILFSTDFPSLKPSSYALRFLEKQISKNIISLSENEASLFFKGIPFKKSSSFSNGFVAVSFNNRILGSAFFDSFSKIVSPNIPKPLNIKI